MHVEMHHDEKMSKVMTSKEIGARILEYLLTQYSLGKGLK